jgi:hypothetical protein
VTTTTTGYLALMNGPQTHAYRGNSNRLTEGFNPSLITDRNRLFMVPGETIALWAKVGLESGKKTTTSKYNSV